MSASTRNKYSTFHAHTHSHIARGMLEILYCLFDHGTKLHAHHERSPNLHHESPNLHHESQSLANLLHHSCFATRTYLHSLAPSDLLWFRQLIWPSEFVWAWTTPMLKAGARWFWISRVRSVRVTVIVNTKHLGIAAIIMYVNNSLAVILGCLKYLKCSFAHANLNRSAHLRKH